MTTLEREMIRWGKLLFERRLVSGWGGNLSRRLDKKCFMITGQHAPLGFLSPKDLVALDQNGKSINKSQRASSETPMHLAVYAGTDAQAIVHVHPPMVLAFSLTHESFAPLSYEEKYTIGEVPIIPQDTPTVTRPQAVVEALKYHPVVIIKGHGTVAIGKDFQEAFLFTDLLEEAVHCQFFKEQISKDGPPPAEAAEKPTWGALQSGKTYVLFSQEHMQALVDRANQDSQFRADGAASNLTTSLTLLLEEGGKTWTVQFRDGTIAQLNPCDVGVASIIGP